MFHLSHFFVGAASSARVPPLFLPAVSQRTAGFTAERKRAGVNASEVATDRKHVNGGVRRGSTHVESSLCPSDKCVQFSLRENEEVKLQLRKKQNTQREKQKEAFIIHHHSQRAREGGPVLR